MGSKGGFNVLDLLQAAKSKMLLKQPEFFYDSKFKPLGEDRHNYDISSIQDIEIHCSGHGAFNKKAILTNFSNYTASLIDLCKGKTGLKIKFTLTGFDVAEDFNGRSLLIDLVTKIKQAHIKINTFHFESSELSGVTLEDFKELLCLVQYLGISEQFDDYCLQCANWVFQEGQPTKTQMMQVFGKLDGRFYCKLFRLQISGWWYYEQDARHLLELKLDERLMKLVPENLKKTYSHTVAFDEANYVKEIMDFHSYMAEMWQQLINGIDKLQVVQLDMRNCHNILKMGDLKKKLSLISKQDYHEVSIVASFMLKSIGMKKEGDSTGEGEKGEKGLKMKIVM